MLKTYRIIPLVFILCLFGLTLITVAPVFAQEQNQAQKQIEEMLRRNEEIMKGFRQNIEQGLHNAAAAQDADSLLRKNNKGIKDDKIWFCEQFTGCRWGSRCADVRIGGGYPIGLVSPADAKRIDGQYLNQCGEGLYAWATQPHGGKRLHASDL